MQAGLLLSQSSIARNNHKENRNWVCLQRRRGSPPLISVAASQEQPDTNQTSLSNAYGEELIAWLATDECDVRPQSWPRPIADIAAADASNQQTVATPAKSIKEDHAHIGRQTTNHQAAVDQPGSRQSSLSRHGRLAPVVPGPSVQDSIVDSSIAIPPEASRHRQRFPRPPESVASSYRGEVSVPPSQPTPQPRPNYAAHWRWFAAGALLAAFLHTALQWMSQLPRFRHMFGRFIWMRNRFPWAPVPVAKGQHRGELAPIVKYSGDAESVEWFNMCFRKIWRVYLKGIERWLADLLQPTFDGLVAARSVPRFVQRLRIVEFTLDHQAPVFSDMRRRTSRKDSDLNGVVAVRYTGGARLLLLIELGHHGGRGVRVKVPVLVSELDLECQLWLKARLAPLPPNVGTISLAFVGPPTVRVQLAPYNRIRIMRIPILQAFLTRLLTVDLPGLMVLPKRLEINIPPGLTSVAEAAVGRDAVMRAVASAVLQSDALEHSLIAALPLGPQSPAGGISLPDSFKGELQVTLIEARALPVWGFPWTSNPWCRLLLGSQAENSRRDEDTSHAGHHRAPVWNQEWTFLVEDPAVQTLEVQVRDSHLTGRPLIGHVYLPLRELPTDDTLDCWLPIKDAQPATANARPAGELHLKLNYKGFEEDEADADGEARHAESEKLALQQQKEAITDVESFTKASSRAAVAATAAATAVAVTKAAAARAAGKAARRARSLATIALPMDTPQTDSNGNSGHAHREDSAADPSEVIGARPPLVMTTPAAGGDGGFIDENVAWQDTTISEDGMADGNAMVAGRSLDEWSERLFPDVSMRVTDEFDADSPYSRSALDAGSHDDSLASATSTHLGTQSSSSSVASAQPQASLDDDDDYTLSSPSDSEQTGITTAAMAAAAQQRIQLRTGAAHDAEPRAVSRNLARADDSTSLSQPVTSRSSEPQPASSSVPQSAHDISSGSSGSSSSGGSGSHISADDGRDGINQAAALESNEPLVMRHVSDSGSNSDKHSSSSSSSSSRSRSQQQNPPVGPSGAVELDVVDPTRKEGERVLSRAWRGASSAPLDRDRPVVAPSRVGPGTDKFPSEYADMLLAEAQSMGVLEKAESTDAAKTSSPASQSRHTNQRHRPRQRLPAKHKHSSPASQPDVPLPQPGIDQGEEQPPGWHPPLAFGVDPAGDGRDSARSAAALWSSVSQRATQSAAVARVAITDGAVAAWGGVKGWTADRLRRKAPQNGANNAMTSYDEDDLSAFEDSLESGTPSSGRGGKTAARRRRRLDQQAREEAAQYQLPKDLPLEDIAKEMQDSWRLKENEVERLLESAIAKSERPWLVLLSALATLIVILLVLLGLRLEGFI